MKISRESRGGEGLVKPDRGCEVESVKGGVRCRVCCVVCRKRYEGVRLVT